MNRPWKSLIFEIIEQLPEDFELRDVLKFEPDLAKQYPRNRHIAAKIRQTLQIFRDQGVLEFVERGRYRNLKKAPRFSPLIDFSAAAHLSSRSQIAKVVLETWAEMNLYCLACASDSLAPMSASTPVIDFECADCKSSYQLKGKDGRFGPVITGAAHAAMLEAVRSEACPNYILVEYDRRYACIVFGTAIKGSLITEDRIIKRKPLSSSAKRAGWVGCNVRIEGLPKVVIVKPEMILPWQVREDWSALS